MEGITDTILMVRPKNFGSNPETLLDNHFQASAEESKAQEVKNQALEEFDAMVNTLREHDISVVVIEDTSEVVRPDAIFPNNWFTTHTSGAIATYPMKSNSRRIERREDVVEKLQEEYSLGKRYGFEYLEKEEQFLEGTGSMILDRPNKIVYAGLSQRTDIRVLEKFAILFGYKKVVFHPLDSRGKSIYHTNVMMALGTDYAVICLEAIHLEEEKAEVVKSLKDTGKEIVDISFDQMDAFAGNMLQVKNKMGQPFLILSRTAYDSLTTEQIDRLSSLNDLIPIPIPTIETYGGGSVRCMMAEVYAGAEG